MNSAIRARLVGIFVAEAEEQLGRLAELANAFRTEPQKDAIVTFSRIAHGLKGAAASLQFEELVTVMHALEANALGLEQISDVSYAARLGRIDQALELLGAGFSRMAAEVSQSFPEDMVRALRATLEDSNTEIASPGVPVREANVESVAPPDRGNAFAETRSLEAAGEQLSIPASEVDSALRLISSLARDLARLEDRLHGHEQLERPAQAVAAAAGRLEGALYGMRLLPADSTLAGVEAEAVELARRLGKEITVRFEGREVRADRRTLQAARTMIRHLMRNAVDHGIEAPKQRFAAEKPAAGALRISLNMVESSLQVSVQDDGVGFDLPAIRALLAERTRDPDQIAALSDQEVLLRFATEGGSTRKSTSEVSGRGLGLSAVAQMARAVGGGLRIESIRGKGTLVRFKLPPELFAADVLTVTVGGQIFGLPVASLERTIYLRAAAHAIQQAPSGRTLAVGETILPLLELGELVGGGNSGSRAPGGFAVVLRVEEAAFAVAVDEIGAVTGVVPLTVAGIAKADELVTGVAQTIDGEVLAVLNARRLQALSRAVMRRERGPVSGERLDVILAEDSLATREVLRVLLEEQGFRVRLAADGEEALSRIEEKIPDVLVTDLNMPRRDGLSLARELRGRPQTWRLPIIALTSQVDEASQRAGHAAGVDAHLSKSKFNASVLLETLEQLGVRCAH